MITRLIIIAALAAAMSACGGGEACREDFVGPPAPDQADLPICEKAP